MKEKHETRITLLAPVRLTPTGREAPLWMTSNGREHWTARARVTRVWRELARAKFAGARQVPGDVRARVRVYVGRGDRRSYDTANVYPLAKAIVDGMVDAGVFVDDDWRHVKGPDLRHLVGGENGPACLVVRVTWKE